MINKQIQPESSSMRCHYTFIKTVREFILAFEDKFKVKMSTEEATKLINEKIENSGGLVV